MSGSGDRLPLRAGSANPLRAVLEAAGFTERGVEAAVGEDVLDFGRRSVPLLLHRTADASPLSMLIRLFLAPVAVSGEQAAAALAPLDLDDLVAGGVLGREGGAVHGLVTMRFHEGLLLAVDPDPSLTGRPMAEDHVMGLSRGSLLLSRLTDTLDAESALDVGTGAGLQALVLARRCPRVLATDITDRAVAFASFNAALNGAAPLEVRKGDLFAPAAGESFDIVVSNPPYVIGPSITQRFMSARLEGDEVCARVARQAPLHLRPGGRAYFLAEWVIPSSQPWQERVGPWFDSSGCDATVIGLSTMPVDEYATRWITADVHDAASYAREFDSWMRWYGARDIEAITFGIVTMRRREGAGESLRMGTLPLRFNDIDGDDLQLALALGRWVEGVDDAVLLHSRLRLDDDARLLREFGVQGGAWVQRRSLLAVERGFADPAAIDAHGERLALGCDGTRTVGELVAAMAEALGRPPEEVAARVLPGVRDLVERGVLLPLSD